VQEIWGRMTAHERKYLVMSILGGFPEGLSCNEVLERFEYYEVLKYPPGTFTIASVFYKGIWYRKDGKTAEDAIFKAALLAHKVTV